MENINNSEIDLLAVFRSLGDMIVKLVKFIKKVILLVLLFLVQNIYIYLLSLALSIGWVYFYTNYTKPSKTVYTATLTASSNLVSSSDLVDVINNLNTAQSSQNFAFLSKSMQSTETDVMKIIDFRAENIVSNKKSKNNEVLDYQNLFSSKSERDTDYIAPANIFTITIDYCDTAAISIIKKGINNYLEQNEYISERKKLKMKHLTDLLEKVNRELIFYDSIKPKLYTYLMETNKIEIDKTSSVSKVWVLENINLFLKKQQIESLLVLSTNDVFSIKTDFVPLIEKKKTSINKSKWIFSFSVVIMIVFVLVRRRKDVLERIRKEIGIEQKPEAI